MTSSSWYTSWVFGTTCFASFTCAMAMGWDLKIEGLKPVLSTGNIRKDPETTGYCISSKQIKLDQFLPLTSFNQVCWWEENPWDSNVYPCRFYNACHLAYSVQQNWEVLRGDKSVQMMHQWNVGVGPEIACFVYNCPCCLWFEIPDSNGITQGLASFWSR